MTLEEAIKHCDDIAGLNEEREKIYKSQERYVSANDCLACAEQHRQLSMWLRELQEYRKIIPSVSEYLNASNMFVSVDETVDE